MSFTPEWADAVNRHTHQLDSLEKRGLSVKQIAEVRRVTYPLFERIKALEGKATLLATRVAELEAQLDATRSKGFRIGTTDSNHARVV